MKFEWDKGNLDHLARHEITKLEAEQVVKNDPVELEYEVVDNEERFSVIGETSNGRILVIVMTLRDGAVRVITGWDAPPATKRLYLQERSRTWRL